MKQFAAFLLGIFGWKVHSEFPNESQKCVMIAAPHTSNWDLVIARIAFYVLNIPLRFTIKKEWMKFPVGILLKQLGAIPIDRSPKIEGQERLSMVDAMTKLFEDNDRLAVLITPEGTRSLRQKWKTGYYYIAKGAGVPIALGYLDYKNKIAGVGKIVWPSDDKRADMQVIMDFYRNITPKYAAKFSTDLEYE